MLQVDEVMTLRHFRNVTIIIINITTVIHKNNNLLLTRLTEKYGKIKYQHLER